MASVRVYGHPASAEGIPDTLSIFGLMGTWSELNQKRPSAYETSIDIVSVARQQITRNGETFTRVRHDDTTDLIVKDGNTICQMESTGKGGSYIYVKNGMTYMPDLNNVNGPSTPTNVRTPRASKCRTSAGHE